MRVYLTAHPDDREALHLMGATLIRLGRSAAAEVALRHCLELDASQDGARFTYADALLHQQKGAEALRQTERLLQQKPDDPAYLNLLAASLGLIGDDRRALEIYERLSAEYPKQPRIWLNYGHALRTVGKSREAVAAYRRCIALAPGLGDAYWSLANLKVATFTPDEEATMLAQIARPDLGADDRLHLHYALGKALEDRGDYAASFDHYCQAARHAAGFGAVRRRRNHSPGAGSKSIFTPAFFADRAGAGDPSSAPIFIVGLPRSGSTLIEQILASHSRVEGTRELPDIGFMARDLGWMTRDGGEYPARVTTLDKTQLAELGRRFLDRTRVHRKLGRPFFIDKMPNNFLHIGLIHLILPNAKIIDARRHPLGACFSTFKQHFAQGQPFSYDLGDLGRYYRDYVELMAPLRRRAAGPHSPRDLRRHGRGYRRRGAPPAGLLAACRSRTACLTFYENDRAVRTVSSEQVRRPIFRDGLDQWRHYEPWLGPLKDALGPALENWRI